MTLRRSALAAVLTNLPRAQAGRATPSAAARATRDTGR